MNSSNTSPAPWFADTGRNAVYDKRVWFDESGARFGDTPNLVVRIEGGRPADVHMIAAAPELLAALIETARCLEWHSRLEWHSQHHGVGMDAVAVKNARAAIARATGT